MNYRFGGLKQDQVLEDLDDKIKNLEIQVSVLKGLTKDLESDVIYHKLSFEQLNDKLENLIEHIAPELNV